MFDVVVIGAGVVGALIARKLTNYKLSVGVLDKEPDVCNVTSSANSAIVHSGYDPEPGSLKAKLNFLGNKMFDQIADELDVEMERIGSLTVALYDEQLPLLKSLEERSKTNGVPVKLLNAEETLALEPNLSKNVKGSLFAPTAGIVNPFTLTVHAIENAVDNGAKLFLNEEVIAITKDNDFYNIKCKSGNIYQSKVVINAAGLYSDQIHKMIEPIDYSITPRKGEYFLIDHYSNNLVKHTIFPLPSSKGKGILVSPTTGGSYLVGPSAEPVNSKDDFSTDKDTLSEVRRQALEMVPGIPFNQVIRVFAGTRPTPSTHDFVIGFSKTDDHFINVSGIESPGLVSSPAIAEYVVNEFVSKVLTLEVNDNFNPYVKKRVHLNQLPLEEKQKLISTNPQYGVIICNCEKVTLGEIMDELNSSVPPKTITGVKKRTRAGFGKCQGGFCQPLVTKFICDKFGLKFDEVLYKESGSEILPYEVKGGKQND